MVEKKGIFDPVAYDPTADWPISTDTHFLLILALVA
jgi:hypothetical protein